MSESDWEKLKANAHDAADTILTIILGMARDRADAMRGLEAITGDMKRAIDKHFEVH